MNRTVQIILLSCLKATELLEKKFHFKLSFKERLQLKLHLAMCDICMNYQKQSKLIEKGIAVLHESKVNETDTQELKSKICEQLDLLP